MKLSHFSSFVALSSAEAEMDVMGITSDSRKVEPGFVFVAVRGAKADGARFIDDAVARGAIAVIAGRDSTENLPNVPIARVDDPRLALAKGAAALFGKQPE